MIRVLIVDDSIIDLLSLYEQLSANKDINCRYTTDSTEALDLAIEFKPDVVLIDYAMPQINGVELVEQLSKHPVTRKCKAVFVSASDDDKTKLNSYMAGCLDFMTKPVSPSKLIESVKRACMVKRIDELKHHNTQFIGRLA